MLRKCLLTISLLLPLVAISAAAQAGATISDKRYWPSEVGPSAYRTVGSQNKLSSAFASDRMTSRFQVVPMAREGGNIPRYYGGPKSLR